MLLFLMMLYVLGLGVYLLLRFVAAGKFWWLALADNFTPAYFLPLFAILPLSLLLNEPRLAAISAMFIMMGIAWFGRYFLPKPNSSSKGIQLKVITFNLYPYNRQLPTVAEWLKNQDADIVLIQETPDEIGEAFNPLYEFYPHVAIQDHENGYLIFSKFPIKPPPSDYYIDEHGWYLHQRVELDIQGQPLILYNVHTKMPHREIPHIAVPLVPDFVLRYDENIRNLQIQKLIEVMQAEQHPVLMTGDFNMGEYASIAPTLFNNLTDAYRTVGQGFGFTWPGGSSEELPDALPPLVRLDYVFTTEHLTPISAEVGPRLGSDHLPLIATVDFRA